MGWIPDFSYRRLSDSDKESFKYMKKKRNFKKGVGALGKRLDQEEQSFKGLVNAKGARKGLV